MIRFLWICVLVIVLPLERKAQSRPLQIGVIDAGNIMRFQDGKAVGQAVHYLELIFKEAGYPDLLWQPIPANRGKTILFSETFDVMMPYLTLEPTDGIDTTSLGIIKFLIVSKEPLKNLQEPIVMAHRGGFSSRLKKAEFFQSRSFQSSAIVGKQVIPRMFRMLEKGRVDAIALGDIHHAYIQAQENKYILTEIGLTFDIIVGVKSSTVDIKKVENAIAKYGTLPDYLKQTAPKSP